MADHDSPISLSPSGGSLARVIVAEQNADHWKIPEGTILASATRRGTAFAIDVCYEVPADECVESQDMGRLHTSFSSVYFHIIGLTLALLEVDGNHVF